MDCLPLEEGENETDGVMEIRTYGICLLGLRDF